MQMQQYNRVQLYTTSSEQQTSLLFIQIDKYENYFRFPLYNTFLVCTGIASKIVDLPVLCFSDLEEIKETGGLRLAVQEVILLKTGNK